MNVTGTPEWAAGIGGEAATPAPGDAWELSWDGVHEGIVVIARVHDDHILGIPVTNTVPSATEIAVALDEATLTLWPAAETGLGRFLLHRRLGTVLSVEQLRDVRRWAADRGPLTTLAPGTGSVDHELLDILLQDYQRRCFIEWPSGEEMTIDVDATGMNARQFHDATGIDAGRIVELWDGHFLTEEDLEALGSHVDAWTTSLTDTPTRELGSPEVKDLVLELCAAAQITERQARNRARGAYALAARTDTVSARTSTRAADTLRVLIQDAHDS